MRVIAKRTLREFWESDARYADAKPPLEAWHALTVSAIWSNPADVKAQFRHASILKSGRVVFNIAGNKFRLIVRINHAYYVVYIRFIGTHRQYDQIDVEVI